MIGDGKITAGEGSDLLDELGRANVFRGLGALSRYDTAMLCSAALVVLGSLLPWGGGWRPELQHLGMLRWVTLIVGVLCALPAFVTQRGSLHKMWVLQALLILIGQVLMISVLGKVGPYLRVGLIVCFVGFIVGVIASLTRLKWRAQWAG